MKRLFVLFCLLTATTACDLFDHGFSQGTFPETPVNLADINSEHDDYNSTSHVIGNTMALIFSSKQGGRTDFNLIYERMIYNFDLKKGTFGLGRNSLLGSNGYGDQDPLTLALQQANSGANELGPYLLSYDSDLLPTKFNNHYGEYLMLFASDRTGDIDVTGDLDIYMLDNSQPVSTSLPTGTSPIPAKLFTKPVSVSFLNSSADDAYPTFDQTYSSIFFTSNRGGSFDIYKATLPTLPPAEFHTRLSSLANIPIERVVNLSSSADDKCPFISGNTVVFTSNRPGGYGGYDLYYSKWDGEQWLTPVNFGPTINTAYDEYRPILSTAQEFTNQLMIFSSNRPGGKGGFDLYRVGISK